MSTVAMCINFYSYLFDLASPPSSLFLFFFFFFPFLLSALLSFPQSQVNGSLLCSLSEIGDSSICGGSCLRTTSFWWVGGCGFAVCDCGGVGLCFGWLPWDLMAWVWVCRCELWWVWVCQRVVATH